MTTVIRWKPTRDLDTMREAMNRFLEDNFNSKTTINVPLDIVENDASYTIWAAVPGLNADQFNIRVDGEALIIEGEIASPAYDDNTRLLVRERSFGRFERRLALPELIDRDHIDATYDAGILTLILPKVEAAQPRTIQVQIKNN